MNKQLSILTALTMLSLAGLPEHAQAATGPAVAGASAPHRASKRASSHGSSPKRAAKPAAKPASPARAEPSRAEPSRAEPSRAEPSRAEPSRAQPTRSNPPSASPAVSAPRAVDLGRAGVASPSVGRSYSSPGNFRGAGPAPSNGRGGAADRGQTDRHAGSADHGHDGHESADHTAHDHRDAAYAGHSAAAHSAGRERAAAARNAGYRGSHRAAAYHSDYAASRRSYAWYQPHGWFVRWAPGRPTYWYHGVFVYGPPPGSPPPPPGHPRANLPPRKADHAGDLSIGVRAGSFGSGYVNAPGFSDFGLGLAARYRLNDPVGIEVQWMYHDDTWEKGTERIEQPLSASLELFAIPWAKVNPYLLGGVSVTKRNYQDHTPSGFVDEETALWGPHIGLGVEFNLGRSTSLSLDGRYLSYLNIQPDDPSRRGALQGNAGLNFYF